MSPRRKISVGSADAVPERFGVTLRVDVVEEMATAENPPEVAITLENTTDRAVAYATGLHEVFGGIQSEQRDPGLLLLPRGYPVELQSPLRPTDESAVFDAVLLTNTLQPGESVSKRFRIWDHVENRGRPLEPGMYRFQGEYYRDVDDLAFTWGFEVEVAEA